jgi:hypothetical protein
MYVLLGFAGALGLSKHPFQLPAFRAFAFAPSPSSFSFQDFSISLMQ